MATPPRAQYVDIAGYTDANGFFKPVTTTRVTVYLAVPYAGSAYTTLATLRSAETGSGTPGNPFDATTGEINFWAAPGSYDIKIEDLGAPAKFATKYIRWDPIPGDKGLASTMITDDAVVSAGIAASAVTSSEILDLTVGTAELAAGAVTLAKMAGDSVDSSKIVDGSIALGDLATALVSVLAPPGQISAYGGSAAPSGYLICDGAASGDRTIHAALFAVIGTTYGVGNGSTTFNMPDLRGRVPMGADNAGVGDAGRITGNDARGNTSGAESVALTASLIPNHAHDISHNHTIGSSNLLTDDGGDAVVTYEYTYPSSGAGGSLIKRRTSATDGASTSNSGTGNSLGGASPTHSNLQPYQVVNYIIKT